MNQPSKSLASLQALRAVAALAVFLFHLVPYFEVAGANLFPKQIFRWGYAGVDIFFVLSGFVLTLSATSAPRHGPQVATKFLALRTWRIYSGYWPFLIAMYLVNLYFGFGRALDDNILGSIFLTDIRLDKLVLGVSWTLTYELYFYVLFSTLFLLPRTYSRVVAGAFAGAILAFRPMYPDSVGSLALGFVFSPYVLEFFLGVLLAKCWLGGTIPIRPPFLWLIFLASFYSGSALLKIEPDDELGRLLTFGVGSGALLLLLLNTKLFETTAVGRGLVRLGDASYTLYLSHLIFIDTSHELGFFALLGQQGSTLANLGAITFITAVCLFSIAFYRLYEKPSYLWLKGRL